MKWHTRRARRSMKRILHFRELDNGDWGRVWVTLGEYRRHYRKLRASGCLI